MPPCNHENPPKETLLSGPTAHGPTQQFSQPFHFPYIYNETRLFLSNAVHTTTGSGILVLAISSAVRDFVSRAISIWVSILAVPCFTKAAGRIDSSHVAIAGSGPRSISCPPVMLSFEPCERQERPRPQNHKREKQRLMMLWLFLRHIFAQLGNSTPLPEMAPTARFLAAVATCGRTHRHGQSTRSTRCLLACLEQRCLKKSHILVPPKNPCELVGDQVDHLDAQHGAVDQKVAALVEDRVLSVQRA